MDSAALEPFDPPRAKIAELKSEFMAIVVSSPDDHENYTKAHRALMVMVKLRTGLDKARLAKGAAAREFVAKTNDEAKELLALMSPVEDHLAAQKAVRDDHIKKIEAEAAERKERERKVRLDTRIDRLQRIGVPRLVPSEIEILTDEQFEEQARIFEQDAQERAARAEQEAMERAEREIEEQARRTAEADRVAAERAEMAKREALLAELERKRREEAEKERAERESKARADQAKLDAERAEINAAREKVEAQQRAIDNAAKAKAIVEEQDKLQRERKERREAMKSDIEKVKGYMVALRAIPIPMTEFSHQIREVVDAAFDAMQRTIA